MLVYSTELPPTEFPIANWVLEYKNNTLVKKETIGKINQNCYCNFNKNTSNVGKNDLK